VDYIVIKVNRVQSLIYGPVVGYFLAIRESGFATNAEDFVTLANSQPCWIQSIEMKLLSARRRRRC
jgi:hypothetical protein